MYRKSKIFLAATQKPHQGHKLIHLLHKSNPHEPETKPTTVRELRNYELLKLTAHVILVRYIKSSVQEPETIVQDYSERATESRAVETDGSRHIRNYNIELHQNKQKLYRNFLNNLS